MVSKSETPYTPEERFVVWSLGLTYVFYALGALYIAGPVIGWLLVLLVLWRAVDGTGAVRAPSAAIWLWWAMMGGMLVSLVVGHMDYNLSLGQTIKSIIGWAKGWAMFPVFLMAGACLQIRLQALARGANLVGLQTVLITPILLAAPFIGLPGEIWVSPLKAVGGPGPEFFSFRLYSIPPDGGYRWAYFAPWAPGAGIAAVVIFALGARDRDWRWRCAGIFGALLMVALVKSRLALLGLPFVMCASYFTCRLHRPWVLTLGAAFFLTLGLLWGPIVETALDAKAAFDAFRSDSTRVRAALQSIAKHRYTEAALFGHGIQDKGTHIVEFMPIGSHHTWNGLLFVKGLVGVAVFAIPFVWTTLELIVRGFRSRVARAGLATLLAMWVYSFGENVEILIYLFWAGLVAAGRGLASPGRSAQAPDSVRPDQNGTTC